MVAFYFLSRTNLCKQILWNTLRKTQMQQLPQTRPSCLNIFGVLYECLSKAGREVKMGQNLCKKFSAWNERSCLHVGGYWHSTPGR